MRCNLPQFITSCLGRSEPSGPTGSDNNLGPAPRLATSTNVPPATTASVSPRIYAPNAGRRRSQELQAALRPPSSTSISAAAGQVHQGAISFIDKTSAASGSQQNHSRSPLSSFHKIEWEEGKRPLLGAAEFDFHQLTSISAEAKSGSFGSVVLFQNEKGTKIAAKTMLAQNNLDNGEDELTKEFKAHEKIVNTVGPHRNLVAVHGIAAVPVAGEMKRALLMDAVPGAIDLCTGITIELQVSVWSTGW